MNALHLYNRLTRSKQTFSPRSPGRVKLFTCGPSVYRRQHLGNYRTYLFEDVLQKYLEYTGLVVERVINFTDIEDKAIDDAREKQLTVETLRQPVEKAFFRECRLLKIHLPKIIPRASTSVTSAVDLIQRLIARGHAYRHDGAVYYDPLTYRGFGRLYGLDIRKWPKKKVRFSRDTYPGQRWNMGDFILWHGHADEKGDVWWDTEIGRGRPSWNIQDSAMIAKHLGFEIDIHTGGIDNLFRHHDYTLSIMEGASGKQFCPWWLHGGHLLVNGRKMSKSKGNVTYIEDLLEQGFSTRQIRFFLLYGPYGGSLDLKIATLEQRAGYLERIRHLTDLLLKKRTDASPAMPAKKVDPAAEDLTAGFEACMNDNLDFAGAFDQTAGVLMKAVQEDRSGGLSTGSRMALRIALRKVDSVFNVLF